MHDVPVAALVDRARAGDPRAVARLVTLVENESPALREITRALLPHTGRGYVLGITGAPGVGKSTTTTALVTTFRERGARVGVLAVDPSSPFTGGALLGDRVRMQEHATDADVYIRSMATRGHLGGLAQATPQAVRVLDGAGCDVIMVETVGVGQSEVEVAAQADTTLVLMAPGMGDGVQAAKAGILEVGDVFVVNKADHDGAEQVVRDLRETVRSVDRAPGDWRQPIVSTVASKGKGLGELVEAIDRHRSWSETSGERERRSLRRARGEIEAIAATTIRRRFASRYGDSRLDELAARVLRGDLDPYSAAERVIELDD